MGITAFPFSSVIDVPTARILGRDDAGTGAAEALTNLQLFAILGTGTPSASTYLRGDGTWAAVSTGVNGSTGSVDNAVLRADGTGEATLQASSIVITDNYTSSPNATVNHASIQATGDTTNVSVSVVPKGSGAFCLAVPDGTSAGGNARGQHAVDLQVSRGLNTQVASGQYSFVSGFSSAATNRCSVAFGYETVTTGEDSFGAGQRCTASGQVSMAININTLASGSFSFASGLNSTADRVAMRAHASGSFSVRGDSQYVRFVARAKTTGTTPGEMRMWGLDGEANSFRLTIPSGKILHATVHILGSKSDATVVAIYMRQVAIKNVGGTTSLVGTVNTIGADEAAGTSIAITADDTNDALRIAVTGVTSETWRWVAVICGVELAYGT